MAMDKDIREAMEDALRAVKVAASSQALEEVRVTYLGKKGRITALLKALGNVSPEERPTVGALVNEAREAVEKAITGFRAELAVRETEDKLAAQRADASLPGVFPPRGARHPLTQVSEEVLGVFRGLGFSLRTGPEVETDYYNFEALNFPPDHPAREMQDTFFVDGGYLLRTHTSAVQVRTMEAEKPPLRVVSCGKVYRCDSDVTHSPMFHQIEGFMVDDNITFGDLKGVLTEFLHGVFGKDQPVRFRPSFFPFTEPSAEVDIGCVLCGARGCRVCKGTGWLEILGSGMIHPEVFRFAGYDPGRYSGFAFGMGIERVAMLKFGVDDIRLFYENDARFLGQF